jgi:ABC-type transport system involved in multi-copper enzyme maturation permease subunit
MTTLTLHRSGSATERGIMVARTVRSEFTKVRSVRSTYWTLTLMVLASLAWCVAYCLGTVHHWPAMSPQDRANFDPAQSSVLGVALLGQLVIVVFGALMLTSEYSTGSMRTSLTVMPRRAVLYGAKLAVFAAISLGVALVTSFGAFFLGQALLGSTHAAVSLAHPGALRSVLITALYAEVCGLIAFGVGALVRNTAAALTIAYGSLTLLPQLVKALPTPLYHAVVAWVPGGDAIAVMTATSGSRPPHMFSAWGELAVFAAYAAVLLIAGAVQFRTRDA